MALALGTRLGPYEVTALLGAGGMGEVYRAHDTTLGRDVAIKVLPAAVLADPLWLERFEREKRVLATLNHQNIGAIYGVEHADGIHGLILELVDGPTLADRLARGPLPLNEALTIARQMADALDTAHERGIVHRDIKPSNVAITNDGVVKVLDFGLAKIVGGDVSHPGAKTVTTEGTVVGTAAYMSPEQACGQAVDRRTDIWAFGCVLFEMLARREAFGRDTRSETIAAVLERDPPWDRLPAATPSQIRELLRRCLEKEPKRRLRDIGDARLDLDATGKSTADLQESETRLRRLRRTVWFIAIAAATAGAIATWMVRSQPERALQPLRLDVITPATADPESFALSPDGRHLVFAATIDGQSKLWLRSLDETTAQPLTGTDDASSPFWAPDSRAIGFFADGKLSRYDLGSGVTRVLCDALSHMGGTWNHDGVILFALNTPNGLMRVSATGGTPTPVMRGAPGQYQLFPTFLPDDRQFLFVAGPDRPQLQGIYIGSLDASDIRWVIGADTQAVYAPPGYLLMMRQGLLLAAPFDAARGAILGEAAPIARRVGVHSDYRGAFSVSASGLLAYRELENGTQLTWVKRDGTVLRTLGPVDRNTLSNPELSPDGQRAAVMRTIQGNLDVWLIDTTRAVAERLTSDESADGAPVWSPDGRQIAFGSNRNGAFNLFQKSMTGTGDERPLLSSPDDKAPEDWSQDGRFILYVVHLKKTGKDELWVLPVGEKAPKEFPVVPAHFAPDEGQISPDGKWLAFRSLESGPPEIYVSPFQRTGRTRLVSAGGGSQPRWRRNGRELFYIRADGTLMSVPIAASVSGEDLEVGTGTPLFRAHLANISSPKPQYAVSQDGQRFLMAVAADATSAPITIVQNWTASLRK